MDDLEVSRLSEKEYNSHSKGPWSYLKDDDFESYNIYAGNNNKIGICDSEDDARLIAAAPILLAWLRWVNVKGFFIDSNTCTSLALLIDKIDGK